MNVIDYKSSNWPFFFFAIILTDNPAVYHTKGNVVLMSPSAKYVWKQQVIILVKWPATSRMGAACLMLKCGQTLAERHLLGGVIGLEFYRKLPPAVKSWQKVIDTLRSMRCCS